MSDNPRYDNQEIDVRNAIEAVGSLFPNQDDPSEYERGYSDAINDAISAVAKLATDSGDAS